MKNASVVVWKKDTKEVLCCITEEKSFTLPDIEFGIFVDGAVPQLYEKDDKVYIQTSEYRL